MSKLNFTSFTSEPVGKGHPRSSSAKSSSYSTSNSAFTLKPNYRVADTANPSLEKPISYLTLYGAAPISNPNYQAAVTPNSFGPYNHDVTRNGDGSDSGYYNTKSVNFKCAPISNSNYQTAVTPNSFGPYNHNATKNEGSSATKPVLLNPAFSEVTVSKSYKEKIFDANTMQRYKSYSILNENEPYVNFYPVRQKGTNYLKYCVGLLEDHDLPQHTYRVIKKYTSGKNWYCSTINFSLATDSPTLETHALFIRQLKYSIGITPMYWTGYVFRG
ncbi:unnamed protein product [Didymodactylos carnosus]|uniref:Uncharacterized protein n=1 Tax=Didymodactylos carnosus TaxID=1234261 RepID=A0A8S2Q9T0_9BILA|nr:unnamed protein product [Didymodactylos carnosus]CAF4088717.1 unnamed protein product [Didymodactylos carnosus]